MASEQDAPFHARRSHARKLQSYAGQKIKFGIRPEDVQDKLYAGAVDPARTVQAVVEVVEPMGAEVYLYMNTGAHSFIARVNVGEKSEVNHKLELIFNMKKAHFFDVNTEETVV